MPSGSPEWECIPGPRNDPYYIGPTEVGIVRDGGLHYLFTKRDLIGIFRATMKALVENPDGFNVPEAQPANHPIAEFTNNIPQGINLTLDEAFPNWDAPEPEFDPEF